jgi:SAM-dependent methyltransferase
VEREYARIYRELYRSHWWWRAREDFLVDTLQRWLSPSGTHRLLDVGCGAGLFFDRLEHFGDVRGVEADLDLRTDVGNVDERIHWGSLESLPDEGPFSAILFLDVLEHLDRPAEALSAAAGLLDPGGVVIATVPAFPILWTRHDDMNHHLVRYTRSSFLSLAESAGYLPLSSRYFFHWTFPAKLLQRLAEKLAPRAHATSPLPKVPPALVNRLLFRMSRLEQKLGLDRLCPFGSSLLFVGRPRM